MSDTRTSRPRVHIRDRYRQLAPKIDEFLSKDLVRRLSSRMIDKLELQETDALVDLGCGTGIYALDIIDQIALRRPLIAVDPVERMLEQIPRTRRIERVCTDALNFSESHDGYSKVLIKDVLYHVEGGTSLLTNLQRNLPVGGVVLLIHSSPLGQHPLFVEALSRWSVWYPEASELMNLLAHIGFIVDREEMEFECTVPGHRYLDMIRGRYFPVLSTFDDREIEEGIKELAGATDVKNRVRFTEHFDFVTAKKL